MVKCPECDAGADLTKDGAWAHCASCMSYLIRRYIRPYASLDHGLKVRVGNTVFEPGKDNSHYKGSGSGSGDQEEQKKGTTEDQQSTESKN